DRANCAETLADPGGADDRFRRSLAVEVRIGEGPESTNSIRSLRLADWVLTLVIELPRAARRYCTWLQATQWLGRNSRNSGRTRWHSATASGQRGWKTQPGGGLIGLGTSPTTGRKARVASTVGSGTGTAPSSAVV